MLRETTNQIRIRDKILGGNNEILIQTMAKTKTSNIKDIIALANDLNNLGCDLLRVSILDEEDCNSLKTIVDNSPLPIIADLHFNKDFAIKALKSGVDKIRINPGNYHKDDIKEIIKLAKLLNTPIRIGINSGSLSLTNELNPHHLQSYFKLLDETIDLFKKEEYTKNLILALKSTDPNITYSLYKTASQLYPYPLHVGVTESGYGSIGAIRSSIALVPLLKEGIGNTIRISLSDSPQDEVLTCLALLKGLGLKDNVPTLITCPTCGRTQNDVTDMARKVNDLLKYIKKDIKVAVMGCAVNGINEAKDADIGLAGGKDYFVCFNKGKIDKQLTSEEAFAWIKEKIAIF